MKPATEILQGAITVVQGSYDKLAFPERDYGQEMLKLITELRELLARSSEPVAYMDWRRVLAEKVDAYIQGESDGEGAGEEAYDDLKAHILNVPVAQPTTSAQPLTCTWTQEDDFDMPGVYATSCGEMWSFTEGGLKDNHIKFCPYCSGSITTSPEKA